jgi:hypothetical protein
MERSTAWLGTFSVLESDPRPLKTRITLLNSGFRTDELVDNLEKITQTSRYSSWVQMIFWGSIFRIGLLKDLAVRNFISARMRKSIKLKRLVSEDDLILLFDIDLLPFVTHKFPKSRIIVDFREIYTEQFGRDFKFRLFLRPIRKFILEHEAPKIQAGYTVSRGLVSFYQDNFGIKLNLIRSVPHLKDCVAIPNCGPSIKVVYLGVAHPLRKIEQSIRTVINSRTDIEFHLYLVGDQNYIRSLVEKNDGSSRVFFHAPVDFHEINETLSKYDLGWSYFSPETENLRNTLPNKFFDYVQAGLGVICGPNLDMIEEDKTWGFGFFTSEYSDRALSQLLVSLTPSSISAAKINASRARKELIWEKEEEKLLQVIFGVTNR